MIARDPTPGLDTLLDAVYVADERVTREEIVRRATTLDLPTLTLTTLDALPEGEYARDEVVEAVGMISINH